MPLKRSRHAPTPNLRKELGRKLYDQAKAASRRKKGTETTPNGASSTPSTTLELAYHSEESECGPTTPSSGTFTPPSPYRSPPLARTSGEAWIPVTVTIAEAEQRLSALYASKAGLEDVRQTTRDLVVAVTQENFLAGFSATVTACAVACLAGTAAGKTLLSKAAIQGLGVRWEAVQAALRVLLRTKKERMQSDLAIDGGRAPTAKGEKQLKRGVARLPEPELLMKARWIAPGRSRLQEVTALDQVSKAEQEAAEAAMSQARLARDERMRKGERVGGRPRRGARSTRTEDEAAESYKGDKKGELSTQAAALPRRTSRKRKAPDG